MVFHGHIQKCSFWKTKKEYPHQKSFNASPLPQHLDLTLHKCFLHYCPTIHIQILKSSLPGHYYAINVLNQPHYYFFIKIFFWTRLLLYGLWWYIWKGKSTDIRGGWRKISRVNYLRNRALNLGEKDLGRNRGTLSILYLGGKVISEGS